MCLFEIREKIYDNVALIDGVGLIDGDGYCHFKFSNNTITINDDDFIYEYGKYGDFILQSPMNVITVKELDINSVKAKAKEIDFPDRF